VLKVVKYLESGLAFGFRVGRPLADIWRLPCPTLPAPGWSSDARTAKLRAINVLEVPRFRYTAERLIYSPLWVEFRGSQPGVSAPLGLSDANPGGVRLVSEK